MKEPRASKSTSSSLSVPLEPQPPPSSLFVKPDDTGSNVGSNCTLAAQSSAAPLAAPSAPRSSSTDESSAVDVISKYDVLFVYEQDQEQETNNSGLNIAHKQEQTFVDASNADENDLSVSPVPIPSSSTTYSTTWQLYDGGGESTQQCHIGNNRFRIFCKMNLDDFGNAATKAQQQGVILKVKDIVTNQCVDTVCQRTGQFLRLRPGYSCHRKDLAQSATHWSRITESDTLALIRHFLEREQRHQVSLSTTATNNVIPSEDEKKRRRRSSLLRRSLSSGNMFEDQKKRMAYRKSILMQLHTLDVSSGDENNARDDDEDDETLTRPESAKQHTTATSNNITERTLAKNGQRRSHSRKSSIHSTISSTSTAQRPTMERRGSWTASHEVGKIHTANALDVIFAKAATCSNTDETRESWSLSYTLVPQHTGNNRMGVMVQLKLPQYMRLAEGDKMQQSVAARQLCRELVETVIEHYNGRFLVEQETKSTSADDTDTIVTNYTSLTVEQAVTALQSVFDAEAALEHSIPKDSIGQVEPVTFSDTSTSQKPNKEQVMKQLHQLPGSVSEVADVHKAAIASLQKRKQRQGVSNKISQLVSSNSQNCPQRGNQNHGTVPYTSMNHATTTMNPQPAQFQQRIGQATSPHATLHSNNASYNAVQQPSAISSQRSQSTGIVERALVSQNSRRNMDRRGGIVSQQSQRSALLAEAADLLLPVSNGNDHETNNWREESAAMNHSSQNSAQGVWLSQLEEPDYHPIHHQDMQQPTVFRRRSTLSNFSQNVIQDMLYRLDVRHCEELQSTLENESIM